MWGGAGNDGGFNDFGFRFYIQKVKHPTRFLITLGLDWDCGQVSKYIELSKTAFADYIPLAKFEYEDCQEAQKDLTKLKEWIKNVVEARPNSKQYIKL